MSAFFTRTFAALTKTKVHLGRITIALFLLICGASFLTACSSQFAESVRKVTYPPDFNYVEPEQLRSDMSQLGALMRTLEFQLADEPEQSSSRTEQHRQRVVETLRSIEGIATKLQAGDAGANHPFLQDYMRDFVKTVGEARVAASLQQPRYFLAAKVSGGCTNCHRVNR
ncbi:hypothetical protein [Aliiglaciecola sp. M165]|uniref:hypothetical protein n=1 Tax=Aliiglaciecola sp. M165 TaxID=2593649 RepID=UPI00117E0B44|nr:hypothetical protein [Aliiglaciecola sp. M165]TRY30672.1 hypothetical protein FM019_12325 [Aliiglaciecola sp. M165]